MKEILDTLTALRHAGHYHFLAYRDNDGLLREVKEVWTAGSVVILATDAPNPPTHWHRVYPDGPREIIAKSTVLDPLGLLKRIAGNKRRLEW